MGGFFKESEIVNNTFSTKYINLSTSVSVEDIGKQGIAKWWRYLGIIFRTFIYGLFWRPQLVYITLTSHGMGLWKDAVIVAICRLLRLDHVFHLHNKGVKKYSQTNVGKLIYPFVFRKAKVILLSPLLYLDISDYVPESRVYYCANGIPDVSFKERIKDISSFEPLHLLFLSNLIKSKGLLDLLNACRLLLDQGFAYQCTIAGGEGDVTENELLAFIEDHGLKDNVKYIGSVSGEAKKQVFEEADLFIHPTHDDCFPLVLLEAMQAGLPIIATKEGAIPEIVLDGVNGILVNGQNPQVLADTIKHLIAHPDRLIQMGMVGKQNFGQEYTLDKFEKRFLKVINQVATEN